MEEGIIDLRDDHGDPEEGDDLCDICMRSGRTVYRTTYDGRTVCEDDDCQEEADRIDEEFQDE